MTRWLICSLLVLCALPVWSAQVSGVVLGPDGAPVAGAEVVAYAREYQGEGTWTPVAANATTGADGRFACELATRHAPPVALVVARAPGFALGWDDLRGEPKSLTIRMAPAEARSGRITDAEGRPRVGVAVRVDSVTTWITEKTGSVTHLSGFQHMFPEVGFPETRTMTDADGRYTLECIPPKSGARLELTSDAFGTVKLEADRGWDIAIPDGGKLVGRIVGGDAVKFAGSHVMCATRFGGPGEPAGASDWLAVGPDGGFETGTLPAGAYRLSVQGPRQLEGRVREQQATIRAGETAVVEITIEAMATVRGRIVSALDGTGVAGHSVSVDATASAMVVTAGPNPVTTREDGSFELPCLPGRYRLMACPSFAPGPPPAEEWGSYQSPRAFDVPPEGIDLGDLPISKVYTLQVRIVDAAGNPVPGVGVTLSRDVDGVTRMYGGGGEVSAEDGTLFRRRLEPGTYLAWAGTAEDDTADKVRVEVGPGCGPITLVLAGAAPLPEMS
jgi:hypothetical protein